MTTRSLAYARAWTRTRLTLAEHPNLTFWAAFAILNGLLFLPSYLFNRDESTFLPLAELLAQPSQWTRQFLVWRNNLDIFRLQAELAIITAVWVLLPWQLMQNRRRFANGGRLLRALFAVFYLFALAYAIYESFVGYLYQEEAVLYAHLVMLVDGFDFLIRHLPVQLWRVALAAAGVILAVYGLLALIKTITGGILRQRLSIYSKAAMALLALSALLAIVRYGDNLTSPKSVVSSLTLKLQRNLAASTALYRQVDALEQFSSTAPFYDYSGHDLLAKPDIYLIFIESYGSVLYDKPAFRSGYIQLLKDLENALQADGWRATSALSESPSWGGGSWMAYTSALFGLRIDSHPQYLALFERFQDEVWPDLGLTLRSQGYAYVHATSIAAEMPDEEWQKHVQFFGVDRWLRYRDIDYNGVHYGWGPAPPDQYVLNVLHEAIARDKRPFLLFWITQNSHYPWRQVPQVVDDWRALNDGSGVVTVFEDDALSQETKYENYFNAITYELSFLTDFIVRTADDDDLFILIGDHQPGYITRRSDGFETPIHIISKDPSFLERFAAFGFEPGLLVNSSQAAMRHEGFYSLFMHALLEAYGKGTGQPPPYLPEGAGMGSRR